MKEYLYRLATNKSTSIFESACKFFLYLLSLVYGFFVTLLIFLKSLRRIRLNCKVISVGNITIGGTGKTTIVSYIATYLKSQGKKVAVLSRGYKSSPQANSLASEGDEPYMLRQKLKGLPVIVDKNRLASARKAIRDYQSDTVILDDGMQQWQIKKDLEIVAIDAVKLFGNQRLIPAGFLREPLAGLRRADIFVLTQVNRVMNISSVYKILNKKNAKALIVEAAHSAQGFYALNKPDIILAPDFLKGKKAVLLSGIGNPEGFEDLAAALGIESVSVLRFSDHYSYTAEDLARVVAEAKEKGAKLIVTTEKDAVRLKHLHSGEIDILVLAIKLTITKNETEFNRRLLDLYNF